MLGIHLDPSPRRLGSESIPRPTFHAKFPTNRVGRAVALSTAMFDRFRIGSAVRFIALMVSALVALPACADEIGGDGEDEEEVEATGDSLVAPGEGGPAGNMLTNPGFETPLSSTDWWLGNTNTGGAFRSYAARRSGSYGLRLTGFAFMTHRHVGTQAGVRYAITGYARKGTPGTTACWMEVQFYPNGTRHKTASVSTTDWKLYGFSVLAPAGTTSARVQLRRDPAVTGSQTDDACYWDDFSFKRED